MNTSVKTVETGERIFVDRISAVAPTDNKIFEIVDGKASVIGRTNNCDFFVPDAEDWWEKEVSREEIAFHECGHALAGILGGRNVEELSIEPGRLPEGSPFFGVCKYEKSVIPHWRQRALEALGGSVAQCLFRDDDDERCRLLCPCLVDGLTLSATGYGGYQDRTNLFAALHEGGVSESIGEDVGSEWKEKYVWPLVNECCELLLSNRSLLRKLADALLREKVLDEEKVRSLTSGL